MNIETAVDPNVGTATTDPAQQNQTNPPTEAVKRHPYYGSFKATKFRPHLPGTVLREIVGPPVKWRILEAKDKATGETTLTQITEHGKAFEYLDKSQVVFKGPADQAAEFIKQKYGEV